MIRRIRCFLMASAFDISRTFSQSDIGNRCVRRYLYKKRLLMSERPP